MSKFLHAAAANDNTAANDARAMTIPRRLKTAKLTSKKIICLRNAHVVQLLRQVTMIIRLNGGGNFISKLTHHLTNTLNSFTPKGPKRAIDTIHVCKI